MEYVIIKYGKAVKREKGSYADDLDKLKQYRPCLIIQRYDRPTEDGSKTLRIHYDMPVTPVRPFLRLIVPLLALLAIGCNNTPADGLKTFPIQDLESGISLEADSTPEVLATSECFDLEQEWEAVSRLAHAFALVESNDNPHAINHRENAVGLLQIRPIYNGETSKSNSRRGHLPDLSLFNIDWVIVGGESGPKARPMKKEWVLNIKRQCEEQNVPFFFKSWGRYGEDGKPCPKDQHDLLDGVKYQAYPKGWEKGE